MASDGSFQFPDGTRVADLFRRASRPVSFPVDFPQEICVSEFELLKFPHMQKWILWAYFEKAAHTVWDKQLFFEFPNTTIWRSSFEVNRFSIAPCEWKPTIPILFSQICGSDFFKQAVPITDNWTFHSHYSEFAVFRFLRISCFARIPCADFSRRLISPAFLWEDFQKRFDQLPKMWVKDKILFLGSRRCELKSPDSNPERENASHGFWFAFRSRTPAVNIALLSSPAPISVRLAKIQPASPKTI